VAGLHGPGPTRANCGAFVGWLPQTTARWLIGVVTRFGARKVEANALVTRPAAGRALWRAAILKYVPADAPEKYEEQLRTEREVVRQEIARLMRRWGRVK